MKPSVVTEEINKLDECALSEPCIDFQILHLTLWGEIEVINLHSAAQKSTPSTFCGGLVFFPPLEDVYLAI